MSKITKDEFRRLKEGAFIEVFTKDKNWIPAIFISYTDESKIPIAVIAETVRADYYKARWPHGVDKEIFLKPKLKTWIDGDLEWEAGPGKRMKWDQAIAYAKSLGGDWRLPTVHELFGLVDTSKHDPACSKPIEMASKYYWANDSCCLSAISAWYVNFGTGHAKSESKLNSYYVRLVRTIKDAK